MTLRTEGRENNMLMNSANINDTTQQFSLLLRNNQPSTQGLVRSCKITQDHVYLHTFTETSSATIITIR